MKETTISIKGINQSRLKFIFLTTKPRIDIFHTKHVWEKMISKKA